jgi:hypothetical protein
MRGVTRIHLPTSTFPVASLSVRTNVGALFLSSCKEKQILFRGFPCHLCDVPWIGITPHASLETDIAKKFIPLD